jgi:chaperonin GroES
MRRLRPPASSSCLKGIYLYRTCTRIVSSLAQILSTSIIIHSTLLAVNKSEVYFSVSYQTDQYLKMKFALAATLVLALEGAMAFTTSKPAFTRPSTQCNIKVDGRTIDGEVKPTNNFVLVKIALSAEQTEGGILLTGKSKVKKTEGTVVSVGPGTTHPDTGAVIDMPVAAGDGVVYGKYDGTEMTIDGVKHTLIRDDDVLVKFKGDELTLESVNVVRDAVLVYVETKESSTEGGILIAKSSSSQSKPSTGKVVKVGPGRVSTSGDLMEMEVAPGDQVKFRDFAGNEVEIDGEEYSVVRMADILAKF